MGSKFQPITAPHPYSPNLNVHRALRSIRPLPPNSSPPLPAPPAQTNSSFPHQPRLRLLPLRNLNLPNLLARAIESRIRLIKRIFRTALELLPYDINLLLPSESLLLLLQLRQPPSLVGRICGFEAALRVAVDFFGGVGRCEGEGVEGVVDAGGVEGRVGGRGGGRVELGEVEAAGFFDGGFGVFGGGAGVFFFGGEEGVFFGFLSRGFGFLLFFGLSGKLSMEE